MRRGQAVRVTAIAIALAAVVPRAPARADGIDDEARQLRSAPSYKRRLAAVLALSKSHDGRAVIALARALDKDSEAQLRRVVALALAKAMDETTPVEARTTAFDSLDRAAAGDADTKVRELAGRAAQKLDPLRAPADTGMPEVFVRIGDSTDLSSQAPRDTLTRLTKSVRQVVVRRAPDVSLEWPTGKLPTQQELTTANTRAYMIAATVSALDITRSNNKAVIACTVSVRIAPWNGTDGAEKWVAHKAASASGSGKAMTGSSAEQVSGGIRDCVMAVSEEVTAKQVIPFLKHLVADG